MSSGPVKPFAARLAASSPVAAAHGIPALTRVPTAIGLEVGVRDLPLRRQSVEQPSTGEQPGFVQYVERPCEALRGEACGQQPGGGGPRDPCLDAGANSYRA